MPRRAKPFFWRDGWYTDAGKERTFLADTEAEAAKALAKLQGRQAQGGREGANMPLTKLVDLFLDDVKATKAERTYEFYKEQFRYALRAWKGWRVGRVKKADVLKLRNDMAEKYKPATVNNVIRALRRLWRWGWKEAELLADDGPAAGVKRLSAEPRSRLMTNEEFRRLLAACKAPEQKIALYALRLTSMRPGEMRTAQRSMLDKEKRLLILRQHKTARTTKAKAPRVISLPAPLMKMIVWLEKKRPGVESLPLFPNSEGGRWTKDYFCVWFRRLRERASVEEKDGEQLVAYSSRHTILTQAARGGATGPQLQLLGGWTSLTMAKHYLHLSAEDVSRAGDLAAEALKKADEKERMGR
ncbi:MAG: hypothetical protein E6G97_18335 [Alphaproteobacteria bacterium]|nr:MAG: hypothetical protein E6G97_18335 [Alphaproteobacteria bacterium]